MAAADPSPYAGASANLRENVKMLVAAFGAIAGVLLAGTPFTGYGSLVVSSRPWWWASGALLVAVVLVFWCLGLLLRILGPELAYEGDLLDPVDARDKAKLLSLARAELSALATQVDQHGAQVFDGKTRFADLKASADAAYDAYERADEAYEFADKDSEDDLRKAAELRVRADALNAAYGEWADKVDFAQQWAAFVRFHARVEAGTNIVMVLGLLALCAIAVFTLAAGSAKKEQADSSQVVVVGPKMQPPQAVADPLPTFDSVRFAPRSASLNPENEPALAKARDVLRARDDLGLLVYAYADTTGDKARNRELATRRAAAVTARLTDQGGISPSRLFVSILAQTDLPVLTGPQVASADNRAVELRALVLPERN